MKRNVGSMDQMGRSLAGVGLIALAAVEPAMSPWGYLGIIPLVSGLLAYCPVYAWLGIDTVEPELFE